LRQPHVATRRGGKDGRLCFQHSYVRLDLAHGCLNARRVQRNLGRERRDTLVAYLNADAPLFYLGIHRCAEGRYIAIEFIYFC
jgi:hypothetical protein